MELTNGKQLLTRAEAKNIMGGLKDVNDECPIGTHEFLCTTSSPSTEPGDGGLSHVIHLRYCIPNNEPDPYCGAPT